MLRTDQAENLRRLSGLKRDRMHAADPRERAGRTRVLAFTGGKGGVGKTSLAVNFGLSLLGRGKKVVLFDADLGLANADVVLDASPRYNLGHVVRGQKSLVEIIHKTTAGLDLIPGGSGLDELVDLPPARLGVFLSGLNDLEGLCDFLIIDTAAGLSRTVMGFVLAADDIITITTPEPTSITDAYATIKYILRRNSGARIWLLVNRVSNLQEGKNVANRLVTVVERFLKTRISVLGWVYDDSKVNLSLRRQAPFYLEHPNCPAARAVDEAVFRLLGEKTPGRGVGGIINWVKNLVLDQPLRRAARYHGQ